MQERLLMEAILSGDSKQALQALECMEDFSVSDTFEDRYLNLNSQLKEINAICRFVICSSQKIPQLPVLQIHKNYAHQIGTIHNVRDGVLLARRMVLDYCACVHGNALSQYSPLIRGAIIHIQQETAMPLSLRALAEYCNVNASYLSNQFKIETGLTLTEYVNRYRIEKSLQLLKYSDMSIARISEYVGILDENYYSRIFKKTMGVTPMMFRKEHTTFVPMVKLQLEIQQPILILLQKKMVLVLTLK